ncbi:MAG: hypothetical protein Q7S36_02015 [Candidatus Liptonbacteria bacterium]|nr:hypothetical protein [Candidatus Liptonbacteria bacterium]
MGRIKTETPPGSSEEEVIDPAPGDVDELDGGSIEEAPAEIDDGGSGLDRDGLPKEKEDFSRFRADGAEREVLEQ